MTILGRIFNLAPEIRIELLSFTTEDLAMHIAIPGILPSTPGLLRFPNTV